MWIKNLLKKRKKMNCEEVKQKINIRTVLESFHLFPAKENKKTAFYFALDREEKFPSLSVDFVKNKAFDFGTGKRLNDSKTVLIFIFSFTSSQFIFFSF